MMKYLEKLADIIVWGLIGCTFIAFIYGMIYSPLWLNIVTASLVLAVCLLWD